MLLLIKILVGIAVGYLVLYLIVPRGTFFYEGVHLPFWLYRLQRLAKPLPTYQKIRYGRHFRQYLLYWKPKNGVPDRHHIVIYIHGSGWQYGRPEMFRANAQWLTEQGFHSFFLSHRRIPQCDIREMREDTALGIKKVMELVEKNGLNHKKILICGNSAGGNLSALAAFDRTLLASVDLAPEMFSAMAFFCAPLDLRVMWPSPPLLLVTRMKNPIVFNLANPIHYLESEVKQPVLLIHGDKDGVAEYENSVVFEEKLRSLGTKNLQFSTLQNGMHLDAASWCFPGHPCCKLFVEWLEKIEREVSA